jgi:hypothetical protein
MMDDKEVNPMAKKATPKTPKDAMALRVRFLRTAAKNSLKHAAEISKLPARSLREEEGLLGPVAGALRRALWCLQTQYALDSGTQFLRDNWNKLTEDQRNGFEQELSDLLNDYADLC